MAQFTNFATLSYNGGTAESNTVTGELLETLAVTKTALRESYGSPDSMTYAVALVNSGSAALTGLTVTDDLGGYAFGNGTVYPLAYVAGSAQFFVNGVLQPAPTVTAGPPLSLSGMAVPAGGSGVLLYEAVPTAYAPRGPEATIRNTAAVTGGGLVTPRTATATVQQESRSDLSIRKALSPAAVAENGQLTYTFAVENAGTAAALAGDALVLSDTFDPRLSNLAVALNGTALAEGTDYTYDATTGRFATTAGRITVPAATYTQNADGTWAVNPGSAVLTVTGTV